ncbi:MAG: hypothetical protein H6935_05055 [Thiobacillus sp.]|nr:hypothetical protein [Thiobacillus sp.]
MYHPAALGSGGLAISFFLYLNFLLPLETGTISFDLLWPIVTGEPSLKSLWVTACLAITLALLATHFALMVWNTREFGLFKQTESYATLRSSSGEISLMVVPLTMAMTVNACFVGGSLLVPDLWEYIEYLFPFAILAFLAIGTYVALLMLVMLMIGFSSMLTHGIRPEAAPSLWLMIPITTLLGITFMRISHGLHKSFNLHTSPTLNLAVMMSSTAFAEAQLKAEQLKSLLPGNSVSGFADALGKNYTAYNSADGVLIQLLGGKMKRKGNWKITESAQFCTQFPTEKAKCTVIFQRDNGKYQRVKDDGMATNTMKKFHKGNVFKL